MGANFKCNFPTIKNSKLNKMEAINFPQANVQLGKDQAEYNNLPAYHGRIGETENETGYVFAMKLSDEDLNKINHHKIIWFSQLTFGRKFYPFQAWPESPFNAPEDVPKQIFNEADLVSFGNFLLKKHNPKSDGVTDADLRNWQAESL